MRITGIAIMLACYLVFLFEFWLPTYFSPDKKLAILIDTNAYNEADIEFVLLVLIGLPLSVFVTFDYLNRLAECKKKKLKFSRK
jgi:hypothetical protein